MDNRYKLEQLHNKWKHVLNQSNINNIDDVDLINMTKDLTASNIDLDELIEYNNQVKIKDRKRNFILDTLEYFLNKIY